MTQADFVAVVEQYVCPVLAGATVTNVVQHVPAAGLVHLADTGHTLQLRPTAEATYLVEVQRSQVFSADDTAFIQAVVEELVANFNKTTLPYRTRVIKYAIEVGICKFLAATNYPMLVAILDGFDSWSRRTYEGRQPTFSVVVDFANPQPVDERHPFIEDVLAADFSALLSSSVESALLLSASGALLDYLTFSAGGGAPANHFVPGHFAAFANYAHGSRVGFTLTATREVLIFKQRQLFFSKQNDGWNYYNHGSTIRALAGGALALRQAVYETLLDVSFARTGGCVAVVRPADVARLIVEHGESPASTIKRDDLLVAAPTALKSRALGSLVRGRHFQDLDRVVRKELVGIDGATIITTKGELLAVGAIIKIGGGSTGGGRLAATKTLAAYGTAIKISADGQVQAFGQGRGTEPEALFEF